MPLIEKKFTSQFYKAVFLVEKGDDGLRLDQFVRRTFTPFSREMIKKKILCGEITLQGQVKRPATKVHVGQKVMVLSHKKQESILEPSLVFEDENIFVVSKPPFMLTHPTGRHLFNCATTYLGEKWGGSIHSIHRLDRETSGLLLLGKNATVSRQLTREFEQGSVKKCYFFVAKKKEAYHGQKSFTENARLAPSEGMRVSVRHYDARCGEGKRAKTHFEILRDLDSHVLGLAFPQTGRQHQIRVHAMINGLPLLGDKLYLGGFDLFQRFKDKTASPRDHQLMQLPRHALHATGLCMAYKGENKSFVDAIPEDLRQWMTSFGINGEKLQEEIKKLIEDYFQDSAKLPWPPLDSFPPG